MKATWLPNWLLGTTLAASALAAPAFGQVSIGVTIGTPPPPIQYEAPPPPPPQVGFVWVQGFWAPVEGRYVWRPGRWIRPPYGDGEWHPARWEHGDHGYRYHEGYWGHHVERHEDHDRDRDDDHHGNGHAYGHYKHDHDDHDHN